MNRSDKKTKSRIAFLFLPALFLLISALAFSSEPPVPRPSIEASDVVFMYSPGDPALYDVAGFNAGAWNRRLAGKRKGGN